MLRLEEIPSIAHLFSPSSRFRIFNSCHVWRRFLRSRTLFSPSSRFHIFNSCQVRRRFLRPCALFSPSSCFCIFNSCRIGRRFLSLCILFHARVASFARLCLFLMHFVSCKFCVVHGFRGNMSDQDYSSPIGRIGRDTRPGGWLAPEVGLSLFA